ncbi:MAG TPA: UDP-N-acetylmuramoyl-tripeptide--D-alanyl-D-alanine ligase [Candidatus Margulisiibacteriota bacterium]|nr:UDP-N-acetylmuramoyl-tripeptide--D-alanyl-D-alanine ligase [Candidatus Margulisiibacteriota bacterium]
MTRPALAEHIPVTSMHYNLQDVLVATGGEVTLQPRHDIVFESITTDSRTVTPGALFVALRGMRYDAHDFVMQALRNGAAGALVERVADTQLPAPLIRVVDTLKALGDLAAWRRVAQPLRVVAVTGSNGKTTTKEMIASICTAASSPADVLKSEGNFNNLIGLPLTLLQMRGDESVAVLEMGMNHPGEIARLTEIARPDYAVITNVGSAHLAGVGGTLAGVAAAKGELFAGLGRDAVIAVNREDAWVRRLAGRFPGRTVTFGRDGEVCGRNVREHPSDGITFDLQICADSAPVHLRLIGQHNVMNALAAAAIGHAMGTPLARIAQGLERTTGPAMRMMTTRLANGVTLINDAYNANPSSVEAALVALRRFSGRPVVVLGEMWELGDESRRAHFGVGERAASLGVQQLFLLGARADAMAAGARAGGMQADAIHVCGSHAEVAAAVVAHWQPGDSVLVKGSRGMKMEEVVRLLEGAGSSP